MEIDYSLYNEVVSIAEVTTSGWQWMNRMAEEEQVMQCFNELVYHEPFSFDLK
jgi:hypothetical protein